MIILTNPGTADKIQAITSAAVAVDVHASWIDNNAGTMTPGRTNTAISTATTTDILAGPASGVYRNLKTLNIRNKDASASVDVEIIMDVSGTDCSLFKGTLRAGDTLQYVEGVGWYVTTTATARLRTARLASDDAKTSTTAAAVSGLSTATGIGTFTFKYTIIHQAAATTTGFKASVNHTGTVVNLLADVYFVSATTTASDGVQDQDVALTTGGLFNVNAQRAKSTAGLGASVSADTANADLLTLIEGIVVVTVDGNLELYWATEVAASASTVKAGSSLVLTKTD